MTAPTQIHTPGDDGWRVKKFPGYMELVGPLWTRKEASGWAYGLLATPAHLNPAGIVHGGLLTSLLDHALSLAAWEATGRRPCVTVQLDTQFLSAAREGQFIEARGHVVRATATLVFVRGCLMHAGSEIAVASAVLKKLGNDEATLAPTPGH